MPSCVLSNIFTMYCCMNFTVLRADAGFNLSLLCMFYYTTIKTRASGNSDSISLYLLCYSFTAVGFPHKWSWSIFCRECSFCWDRCEVLVSFGHQTCHRLNVLQLWSLRHTVNMTLSSLCSSNFMEPPEWQLCTEVVLHVSQFCIELDVRYPVGKSVIASTVQWRYLS
jgi:hypothetical protein